MIQPVTARSGQAVARFGTSRTTAEGVRGEHLPELRQLQSDPDVAKTLGGIRTPEETQRSLEQFCEHWKLHGYGVWMFRDRVEGRFIGYAGLRRTRVGGREEVELLYALLPAHWGQGLATEMAAAALEKGFARIGLPEVVSFTLPTNRASRRVMEKVGFRYERDVLHAGLPHVLYRLPAGEWRRRREERGAALSRAAEES